jgi:N-acetyltransferase
VSPLPLRPVVLRGRFVRLEPLADHHVGALAAAASEDRSTYAFTTVPEGEAGVRAAVQSAQADREAGRGLGFATLAGDRVVGSTRFLDPQIWPRGAAPADHLDSIEIGSTWLAASAQRTVVNTEAKLLMLTHAFEVLRVHRVVLNTDVRNERSRAAIARIGAAFEGVLHGYRYGVEGTPRDTATFAITARDWPGCKAALEARLSAAV